MRDTLAGALMVVVLIVSLLFGWGMGMNYVAEHAKTGVPIEEEGKFYTVIPYKLENGK